MKLVHILLVHDFRTKLFTEDLGTTFLAASTEQHEISLVLHLFASCQALLACKKLILQFSMCCVGWPGNEANMFVAEVVFSWQAKDSPLVVRCCATHCRRESYTS